MHAQRSVSIADAIFLVPQSKPHFWQNELNSVYPVYPVRIERQAQKTKHHGPRKHPYRQGLTGLI